MLPLGATLWLFRTFGEDDRKITKKAQTSEPAARAECLRPYKRSEISNRLAGLRANEQYHQMCGRPNLILPLEPKRARWPNPALRGGMATSARATGSTVPLTLNR